MYSCQLCLLTRTVLLFTLKFWNSQTYWPTLVLLNIRWIFDVNLSFTFAVDIVPCKHIPKYAWHHGRLKETLMEIHKFFFSKRYIGSQYRCMHKFFAYIEYVGYSCVQLLQTLKITLYVNLWGIKRKIHFLILIRWVTLLLLWKIMKERNYFQLFQKGYMVPLSSYIPE